MGEQQLVLEYLVERVARTPGVALAVLYGSFGTPDASDSSDVDMYFVPSEPCGEAARFQAVVDDIGYDLWALPWSRLERIAELEDGLIPLLLDGRVVFSAGQASTRFDVLRDRCRALLDDPEARADAAQRFLDQAAAELGRADLEVGLPGAEAVGLISTALAVAGGTYPRSGPGRVLDDPPDWMPADIRSDLCRAVRAGDADSRHRALRRALAAADARCRVNAPHVPSQERAAMLDGFYEELHSTLVKIPRAVHAGHESTAYLAVEDAVREIGTHLFLLDTGRWPLTRAESMRAYLDSGLPNLIDAGDLSELALASVELGRQLVGLLEERGVLVRRFADARALQGG